LKSKVKKTVQRGKKGEARGARGEKKGVSLIKGDLTIDGNQGWKIKFQRKFERKKKDPK